MEFFNDVFTPESITGAVVILVIGALVIGVFSVISGLIGWAWGNISNFFNQQPGPPMPPQPVMQPSPFNNFLGCIFGFITLAIFFGIIGIVSWVFIFAN
ncbi:hypothetical protein KFU94_35605 [Chloroflexi bacterium TSY]|nr:hypothetical protein [Chloroflexi bacterium TSY]